jgi:hypothetical protein
MNFDVKISTALKECFNTKTLFFFPINYYNHGTEKTISLFLQPEITLY